MKNTEKVRKGYVNELAGSDVFPFCSLFVLPNLEYNRSMNRFRALVLGLLFVLLVLFPGCSETAQETLSPLPPPPVALALQGIIDDGIANTTNLGIAIEIVTPQWSWSSAAGFAALDPEEEAAADMFTRIASVTKTYTAAAIMKLVQDGTIALDDLLATHLPEKYASRLTNADIITIRETLQHTAGIPDYDEAALITQQMADPDTPMPTEVAVYQGLDAGSLFTPGTSWEYTNVGYLLLASVIDTVSGQLYEEMIRSLVIDTLGLSRTIMPTDPPVSKMPDPYMHCLFDPNNEGSYTDFSTMYIEWDRGAGDIISAMGDLNDFHRALRKGQIVGATQFEAMRQFRPIDAKTGYGFAYERIHIDSLGITIEGHNGSYPGATTWMAYWVEGDTYISFNLNGSGSDAANSFLITIIEYLGSQG
jgi:D-alanyl-D-alanine carboxypeptidase